MVNDNPCQDDTVYFYPGPNAGEALQSKGIRYGKVVDVFVNKHDVIHQAVVNFDGKENEIFDVFYIEELYRIYFSPPMTEIPIVLLEEITRLRVEINDDMRFIPVVVRRYGTSPCNFMIINKIDGRIVHIVNKNVEEADYIFYGDCNTIENGKWEMVDCNVYLQCGELTFSLPENFDINW